MAEVTREIPLDADTYKGVNEEELNIEGAELVDGYVDDLGYIRGRPGLSVWAGVEPASGRPGPVRSLHWSDIASILYGTYLDSTLFQLTEDGVETSQAFAFGNEPRHIWAEDGTRHFIASGGRIAYFTTDIAAIQFIADADAPTQVSHIVWMDGYLLALNSNGEINFSSVNDALTWDALDFFTTPGNPDVAFAMTKFKNLIYIFGSRSIEIWQNDGESPFSRISSGLISEVGCGAKHSVIAVEDGVMFLSNKNQFAKVSGSTVQYLSTKYDAVIQDFDLTSDCQVDRIDENGQSFIIFTFPSANRTFAYNQTTDKWSEWSRYRNLQLDRDRWKGNCYAWCPDWNKHAVGSALDFKVFELSSEFYDDEDGDILLPRKLTGHIDWGSGKRKRTRRLRMRLKRGAMAFGAVNPRMMLRWKVNNRHWSNEYYIDLGALGQTEIAIGFVNRKIYNTVQYELSCSDAVPFAVGKMEEDFEVMAT